MTPALCLCGKPTVLHFDAHNRKLDCSRVSSLDSMLADARASIALRQRYIARIERALGDLMTPRSLSVIAADVRAHWPKVNYAAKPYLDAMAQLGAITDHYYADSAESVVLYFLSNATSWRGEDARRIKAELKAMVK